MLVIAVVQALYLSGTFKCFSPLVAWTLGALILKEEASSSV